MVTDFGKDNLTRSSPTPSYPFYAHQMWLITFYGSMKWFSTFFCQRKYYPYQTINWNAEYKELKKSLLDSIRYSTGIPYRYPAISPVASLTFESSIR